MKPPVDAADLKNNAIARMIGMKNNLNEKNIAPVDLAKKVLDYFYHTGLWVISNDKEKVPKNVRGRSVMVTKKARIEQRIITKEQYLNARKWLEHVDVDGNIRDIH